jgi:hypothetical protein
VVIGKIFEARSSIEGVLSRDASLPGYESGSRGTELSRVESSLRNWQLQNKGKKGIRRRKEEFMCDLK